MVAMKPVFVAKAERERLALEAAVSDKRRSDVLCPPRPQPSSANFPRRESFSSERHLKRDWNRDRDLDQDCKRGYECVRKRQRDDRNRDSERDRQEKMAERDREKELEAIKEQYLGSKKHKKQIIKPSAKFRFSFDWESTDDTSGRDMNVLYSQSPHGAGLLFGRGFLAGIDRREQKKAAAAAHEKEA
ncbi:hypothetical protein EJB05_03455, partial [Eragrostis curvula]